MTLPCWLRGGHVWRRGLWGKSCVRCRTWRDGPVAPDDEAAPLVIDWSTVYEDPDL